MRLYRKTWAEIDLDRIKHNITAIKQYANPKHYFCVVKANGYGHDAVEVGKVAIEAGATYLAVAFSDEAIHLRDDIPDFPLFVLGPVNIESFSDLAEYDITVTLHDLEHVKKAVSTYNGKPLKVHLKLDTGMNRVGLLSNQELIEAISLINATPYLELEGLFTHISTADSNDYSHFLYQQDRLDDMLKGINLDDIKIIHVANSATTLHHKGEYKHNKGVRLGIAMYGLKPSDDLLLPVNLKQAFSLHSIITQVKLVKAGQKVGYGATYMATEDEYIATIPIGYADGWLRYHQDRMVEIDGGLYPIVGRVCMDQCMIKVNASIKAGDKVTLLGDIMTVDRAAADLNTINYEIVCSISDRVPRIFKKNGEYISSKYQRYLK